MNLGIQYWFRHSLRVIAALICILFLGLPALRAAEIEVDLELVIAVDVSSSMDLDEQMVQRSGYVGAFSDPIVTNAIRSGLFGRIALTYVEWADSRHQTVIMPWGLIDSDESARKFAAELNTKPLILGNGTSISNGLLFASRLFDRNGFEATRRVIDISGDGPNTLGPHVTKARDAVVEAGVVINGLPLIIHPQPSGYETQPDLADYYHDCVIGGSGAFVAPANSIEEIASTIRRKLIQEIASNPSPVVKVAVFEPQTKADCTIGQKDFNE